MNKVIIPGTGVLPNALTNKFKYNSPVRIKSTLQTKKHITSKVFKFYLSLNN